MTDIIIILILIAALTFAARSVIKRRGRCSCGCEGCIKSKSCGKKIK